MSGQRPATIRRIPISGVRRGNCLLNQRKQRRPIILVCDDVEETRDGINRLLTDDGYVVDPARNEADAVERARRQRPDLILVSFGGSAADVMAAGRRIRDRAGLTDDIPVVVFCVPTLREGAEVALGENIYATHPDNFNQLRAFIERLLGGTLTTH
jgi:CheY-like chemotaxis protein